MYLKLLYDGNVVYPYGIYDLRRDNPDTSFPNSMSNENLAQWDVYPVTPIAQPEYNHITQNCTEATPVYINGEWTQQWDVTPATEEEIIEREASLSENNRQQASQLLQQTDWVELGDVSDPANPPYLANKAAFTAYRSQLRMIAINPPLVVDSWPVKPEEIWITQ